MRIPLNYEERTGHLPRLIYDVNVRLRRNDDSKLRYQRLAAEHGVSRQNKATP